MTGEWTSVTLGQIADASPHAFVDGPFGSNLPASCYTPGGVPVIRGSNLSLGTTRFRSEGFVYVSDETASRLRRSCCKPFDIIFTKKGTLGQTGIVPERSKHERYLLSGNQMKVTVDRSKADPLFIYSLVSSPASRAKIIQDSEATGVPKTNLQYLRAFPILLPPVAEQATIAQVLGALDDKIELNRRMNATLEAMARALFQNWFVDFDPVRAKCEGRQPAGLDAETAALFPAGFQDSCLGPIPRGWTVGTLNDVFNLTMGQSPPGHTYNEEGTGVPLYQGRTDFGFRFPTRRVFCTAPTRFAKPGDTLVSVRAPVGDINIADEECCVGRGVAAVRHKSGATSFTYYAMLNLAPDFARFEGEGTVFGSINKQAFENLALVLPPPAFLAAYERYASPLDNQIRTLEHQSRTLATLRDTLLPKLLSGELRVPAAAKLMEARQ